MCMLHHCFLLNRMQFFYGCMIGLPLPSIWNRASFNSFGLCCWNSGQVYCKMFSAIAMKFWLATTDHKMKMLRIWYGEKLILMPSGALQAGALLVICTTVELHRKAESMDRYMRKEISTRWEKRGIGRQWSLHCGPCILTDLFSF